MADFSAICSHFESNNLPYFTVDPKSHKPIKAVIWHPSVSTPAENISDVLADLGFGVISFNQMSATHQSPEGGTSTVDLLFLINLRTSKSQEIFELTGLCHIAIWVEEYNAQTVLTQCYISHKFGQIWANCKQLPLCMWCGGDPCLRSNVTLT
jgi:hypothetical protein